MREPENLMSRFDFLSEQEAEEIDRWIALERAEFAALLAQFGTDFELCGERDFRFSVPVENISN